MSSERWERTKEILEQALRLAPEERQAYLASACEADDDLRMEVESLIASHEEAGSQFFGCGRAGGSATGPVARPQRRHQARAL
jgi:hypothetical protein